MTLGRYKRAWRNEWLGVDAGQQLIFTLGRPRFAMQEVLTNIAAGVLGVPLYLSGLFVWPVWSFLGRRKKRRARALRWVFFGHLVLLLVLIGFFLFSHGLLEHPYSWLILMIMLNILFTPLAIWAAFYDYDHSDDHAV